MTDYDLLSNKELNEIYNNINEEYKKEQAILKSSYMKMVELSNTAIKIKEIIEKRGGKIAL